MRISSHYAAEPVVHLAGGRAREEPLADSRSETGHWDLGVNRRRLRTWVAG